MQEIINQHKNGKWYFWDEVWVNEYGPYNTKEKAEEALRKYCKNIEEYCGDELSR